MCTIMGVYLVSLLVLGILCCLVGVGRLPLIVFYCVFVTLLLFGCLLLLC